MPTMNTYTGRVFDPMAMTPGDVCIEDIAHALSMLCRGGGHIRYFFSVAQHSMNCAKEAEARGYSRRVQLACLLHDATEAYLSDIIRPVKCHLTNYNDIEDDLFQVIMQTYGLDNMTGEECVLWHMIDDEMLTNELRQMMPGEENRVSDPLASRPDFREKPCRQIEAEFLAHFHTLTD